MDIICPSRFWRALQNRFALLRAHSGADKVHMSFSFVPGHLEALDRILLRRTNSRFLEAMEICCSGVLTPSRFGNSRPRFQPLETITPYRFASSSATDATRSGFPSTSTLYSSWPSSSSATEWNRGSCVPAEIAFSMISSATHTFRFNGSDAAAQLSVLFQGNKHPRRL
mgnify:CR=1 FL=1